VKNFEFRRIFIRKRKRKRRRCSERLNERMREWQFWKGCEWMRKKNEKRRKNV
jgi:hypothetical protein